MNDLRVVHQFFGHCCSDFNFSANLFVCDCLDLRINSYVSFLNFLNRCHRSGQRNRYRAIAVCLSEVPDTRSFTCTTFYCTIKNDQEKMKMMRCIHDTRILSNFLRETAPEQ